MTTAPNNLKYNLDDLLSKCQFSLNESESEWMSNQLQEFIRNIHSIIKFANVEETEYIKFWQVGKLREDEIIPEKLDVLLSNTHIDSNTNFFTVPGTLYVEAQ